MAGEAGFIFLSYGHDEFAGYVQRIKTDFERRGYQVWFDLERLKAGVKWEDYIDDGINQAAAAGDKGLFVLVMTPHSVRRPDGFCLNELTRALSRQLFVIPVMMQWCEPPLSICRSQWLDMRTCFPAAERTAAYGNAIDSLVDALTTRRLDFDGIQTKLITALRPLDFSERLRRYLPRFAGRQWIFAKLDQWLADGDGPRIFWLTGRPGVGKSALAAWYSQNRREVAAIHFCRSGQTETTDARRVVQSIAYQLSSQFPVYKDTLNLVNFGALAQGSAADWLANLLTQSLPVQNPRPGQRVLIILDGLDEAGGELANLIASAFGETPDWLRLLVTSRPEAWVKSTLQGLTPEVLKAEAPENAEDAKAYIRKEYAPFAQGEVVPEEAVTEILKRSEGLFLYLERVLEDLQFKRRTLADIDSFPQGLGESYDQYFKRQFPDEESYASIRPVLEIVVAAREPLGGDLMRRLMRWPPDYDLRAARAALGSLFVDLAGRFEPFHKTVVEWITTEEKADRFLVSRAAGEKRLAEEGLAILQTGQLDSYLVKFLPAHLAAASCTDELRKLLLDYGWLQAKLRDTDAFSVCADYRLLTPDESDPVWIVGEALRLCVRALASNPAELPAQLHGRLLGFDQPEIRALLNKAAQGKNGLWLKPLRPNLTPPGTVLVAALSEPGTGVRCAAINADGTLVVFANEKEVKLWQPVSGSGPVVLYEVTGPLVAISRDSKRVAISSAGGNVEIRRLDEESGEDPIMFNGLPEHVAAIAFAQGGSALTAVSIQGEAQTWDLTGVAPHLVHTHVLPFHGNGRDLVAIAGEAGIVFSSGGSIFDSAIDIWDLHTGLLGTAIQVSRGPSRIAVTPDGATVAVADTGIEVFHRGGPEPQLVAKLKGHEYLLSALAISTDGNCVVSAASDAVNLWDLRRGAKNEVLTGRAAAWPRNIEFGPTPETFVRFSDGHSRTYSLKTQGCISSTGPREADDKIVDSSDGARQVIALPEAKPHIGDFALGPLLQESKVGIRERETGRVIELPLNFQHDNGCAAFYPDGSRVVIGTDYKLTEWDAATGSKLRELQGNFYYGPAVAVAQTAQGIRIISVGKDNAIRIWDDTNLLPLMTLPGHSYSVWGIAVMPGAKRFVTVSGDQTLRVWNLLTGAEEALFSADAGITCCSCTPDGKLILAGDLAGQVHFLEIVEAAAMPARAAT